MELKNKLGKFNTKGVASGFGSGTKYAPYELNSTDYINFAVSDLQDTSIKSRVNAIGNIKRSIDCRIDTLLDYWGLLDNEEIVHLDVKLEKLKKAGVLTPTLLTKINTLRNKTEHRYEVPEREKVEDYLDVANLFISYTDKFLRIEIDGEILDIDSENYTSFINFKLDNNSSTINISGDFDYEITKNEIDDYLYAIKFWYECTER